MLVQYMKSTTVFFLFEFEQYVEHAYYKLNQYTHGISEKFKYFVSFLRQKRIVFFKLLEKKSEKFPFLM